MKTDAKKIISIISVCFLLCLGAIFGGCTDDNLVVSPTAVPGEDENDINMDEIVLPDSYDMNIWTQKFWKENISYYEPISFTEDEEGNLCVGKLLYTPDKILEVRSGVGFNMLYEGKDYSFEDGKFGLSDTILLVEGRDYTIVNNKIKLTSDKRYIDVMTYEELYPHYKEGEAITWLALQSDNSRYINIDGTIKNAQIYVTYTHKDTWDGFVPASEMSHLPGLKSKLDNKEKFNFVIYGDSIATGADATGNKEKCIDVNTLKTVQYNSNGNPKTPSWAEMSISKIRDTYGYEDIVKINKAAGSSESGWGAKNAEYLLTSNPEEIPDVLVIAFGMNEPGRSPESFKTNLNTIIDTVLSKNKDCEFILMSSIESNPMYGSTNFSIMEDAMYELQSERSDIHIAVCPVNTVYHEMINKGKCFYDLTSNNINHPNDFLARVYAMTLLATLDI